MEEREIIKVEIVCSLVYSHNFPQDIEIVKIRYIYSYTVRSSSNHGGGYRLDAIED